MQLSLGVSSAGQAGLIPGSRHMGRFKLRAFHTEGTVVGAWWQASEPPFSCLYTHTHTHSIHVVLCPLWGMGFPSLHQVPCS